MQKPPLKTSESFKEYLKKIANGKASAGQDVNFNYFFSFIVIT